jgi:hypothetical protein
MRNEQSLIIDTVRITEHVTEQRGVSPSRFNIGDISN